MYLPINMRDILPDPWLLKFFPADLSRLKSKLNFGCKIRN